MKRKSVLITSVFIGLIVAGIALNYFMGIHINQNERHVNSIEGILLRYHKKLPTGCQSTSFSKMDNKEIGFYKEVYQSQRKDARKDSFVKIIHHLFNYLCGTQICPCTDEAGGHKFAFVFDELQPSNISKTEYSFSIIFNNNEIDLPIERKILNGREYQSVIIDAEKFPDLNNSKFQIAVNNLKGLKKYCFNISYDSLRAGARQFKGDMIISNEF